LWRKGRSRKTIEERLHFLQLISALAGGAFADPPRGALN
jgi:hypothetical protein